MPTRTPVAEFAQRQLQRPGEKPLPVSRRIRKGIDL